MLIDDSLPIALSWTVEDEPMARSSHAIAAAGRVWLVDPVADEEALAKVEAMGDVAGVLQLLDRHPRDGAELAARYGVELLRLPRDVPDAPFELHRTVWVPKWRELHLWWPDQRLLLVSEAIGTVPYFAAGRRAGVHPFLRALPPNGLRDHGPEHLLVGHGPSLHDDATGALIEALDHSRGDVPRAVVQMVKAFRP